MRLREIVAIGLLAVAAVAHAQDYPQASSVRSMGAAQGHSAPMDAFRPSLNCARKNKCVILVNNSTDYYVVGFYIDDEGPTKRFGSNGRMTSFV